MPERCRCGMKTASRSVVAGAFSIFHPADPRSQVPVPQQCVTVFGVAAPGRLPWNQPEHTRASVIVLMRRRETESAPERTPES